jgi:hypothetical protein
MNDKYKQFLNTLKQKRKSSKENPNQILDDLAIMLTLPDPVFIHKKVEKGFECNITIKINEHHTIKETGRSERTPDEAKSI